MKKLTLASAVLTSLGLSLGACSSRSTDFLVIGHQGAPAREPGNSMRSFRSAAESGARGLWTQVSKTKDGQWVVAMDSALVNMGCLPKKSTGQRFGQTQTDFERPKDTQRNMSPADPSVRPSTGTLSELLYYECQSFQREDFPQQAIRLHSPIVTVRELFAYVRGFNTNNADLKIFLELSKDDFKDSDTLVEEALRADFSEGTVFFIEKGQSKGMSKIQTAGSLPSKDQPAYAVLSLASADPTHVGAHNSKNERVIVEVVNNPEEWDRLLDLNVYGIVTDDPHRLVEHLRGRKKSAPSQVEHRNPTF